MSLGDWLFGLFDGMGDTGAALCIFILFLVDALLFPTLPELFMVLGFNADPTWQFGIALLLMAVSAELIGVFTLYLIVSRIGVPERIRRIAGKYVDFLVFSDERIVLVNRIAPMIPFLGAFIAIIDTWDPKKCAAYIVIGCVAKYGIILLASGFFLNYLGTGTAQTVTLAFIFAVIIVSFIASAYKKRQEGLES